MDVLVLALLFTGVGLHVAPWVPVARRLAYDGDTSYLRWPPLLLATLLGFASTAVASYALFILEAYLWVWVLTANAAVAFILYLVRRDDDPAPLFAFEWPAGGWAKAALGLTLIACIIRFAHAVASPVPRSPDTFIHGEMVQRLLLGLQPLPGPLVYPLGMHGLMASMSLGVNPSSIHLVLPGVNAVLLILTVAWWLQHLLQDQRWTFFALCLLCVAPFNPFAIVANKSMEPLPQAFAYTMFAALLHEWGGFKRTIRPVPLVILSLGLASFHNITTLYVALFFGAIWVGSLLLSRFDEQPPELVNRTTWVALLFLLPSLVGLFTLSGLTIDWRDPLSNPIDQTPGFDESHVSFEWDTETSLVVATVNTEKREEPRLLSASNMISVEVGGDPFSVRALPDVEGEGWSLALTTSHDAQTVVRVQDNASLLAEPPVVKLISSNLSSIMLSGVSINGSSLPSTTCVIVQDSVSVTERTCGLDAETVQYHLNESASFGWNIVEYGWDVGLGFTSVGAIDLWSDNGTSDSIEVPAQMPNSTVVLSEGEPLTVQLLDERPTVASLRWNSSDDGCLGGGTGATSLWKNGSILRLGLSNSEEIKNCKGSLEIIDGDAGHIVQTTNLTLSAPAWPFPTSATTFVCLPSPAIELESLDLNTLSIPFECILEPGEDVHDRIVLRLGDVSGLFSTEKLVIESIYWQNDSAISYTRVDQSSDDSLVAEVKAEPGRFRVWMKMNGFYPDRTISIPLVAGDTIGWVEINILPPSDVIVDDEGTYPTASIAKGFLIPSFDEQWFMANWWWFIGAFVLNLFVFLRPSIAFPIRLVAFGGLALQLSQLTGIFAYPTDWGQQRLSQLLAFPLAITSTGVTLLAIDTLAARSSRFQAIMAWPSEDENRQRVLSSIAFIGILSMVSTPIPPIISEAAWDAAITLDDGRYYTEKSANEMSGLGGEHSTFLSGGLLVARWGTGDSSLADWRCARQSFSVLIVEDDVTNFLRTWLTNARSEDPERWSVEERGNGWTLWVSDPPEESIDLWVTQESGYTYVWSPDESEWIVEDEFDFREVSSQALELSSDNSEVPGWLCNPTAGTVSPRVNVVT